MHLSVDALIVEKRPRQLLLDEQAQRRLTVVTDPSVHIVGVVVGLVAGGFVHLHVQQGLLGVHLTEHVLAGVDLLDTLCSRVVLQGAVDLVELVQCVLSREACLKHLINLARCCILATIIMNFFYTLDRIFLFRLQPLVDLLKNLVFNLVIEAVLPGGLGYGARWQVQVDLVDDLGQMALHEGNNDGLGELLAIGLASAIMLRLDMKIQRAVATIELPAISVRARILLVDHIGWPPIMLLTVLLIFAAAVERGVLVLELLVVMHLVLLLLLVLSVRNHQLEHLVADVVASGWLQLRGCSLLVGPLLVSGRDSGCGGRALVLF